MVSLADTSATFAAMAVSGPEVALIDMPVAVSISTQIVGNVQEGTIRSESTVAHPGRTLMAVTTRITADGGRLLALVNSSHFVRQSDPHSGLKE
jgi:acyl-coenzyme A thioesterase PaaI-like protein